MNQKILIAMFVAFGMMALGGSSHAMFDTFLPSGAKAKGDIVGGKLMLQGANGKWAPAPDGTYKMGDGKSVVVKGGAIGPIQGGAIGPMNDKSKMMGDGPAKKTPDTQPAKGGPKPDKKGQMAHGSGGGEGRGRATPMPQGIQGPAKATPMPQGTQGSRPPLGSPIDPPGPEDLSRPGGGPPPPMPR